MTDLFPDYVPVHPVPCELDAYDSYLTTWLALNPGMHGPAFWPGSPCLIQGDMCLTCGGVDPEDYDPAVHGPDQSLMARRGRVRVTVVGPGLWAFCTASASTCRAAASPCLPRALAVNAAPARRAGASATAT